MSCTQNGKIDRNQNVPCSDIVGDESRLPLRVLFERV